MDLTRSAARGKPFWHTEAQGGPLWLQPQLKGRRRDDGRITTAPDLRIWNLISMASGAGGILYTRHRPLLDGPLFGAFAPYNADGTETERSVMASALAKWANESGQKELFAENAQKLKGWVGKGGVLISEACPGYFGDDLRMGQRQPNLGLDELFGVTEEYAEFAPDLTGGLEFELLGRKVRGGGFLQRYRTQGAKALAWREGFVIAAGNSYGSGKTLLVGASLAEGYSKHPGPDNQGIFAELLRFAAKEPFLKISDRAVAARIHRHGDDYFLWLVNPVLESKEITVKFSLPLKAGKIYWPGGRLLEHPCGAADSGGGFRALLEGRNALVLALVKADAW